MTSVLYDEPGPRARRRSAIAGGVALLVVAGAAVWAVQRLTEADQFSYEKWGPIYDPSNEYFEPVWQLLGRGLRSTLIAAAIAIVLSLAIGTVMVTLRTLLGRTRPLLVGLMELLRGLPVVVLIFMAYRILPDLGVNVGPLPGPDGLWYLVIGLTAYNSVVFAEILRSGIVALPRGQAEAAQSLGLSQVQTLRIVLLPQAFRTMLPALVSQLIVVLKDTSLAGLLAIYPELLKRTNEIIADLQNPIQMYFVTGLIFIVLNLLLSRLAVWIQRRSARGKRSLPAVAAPEQAEAAAPAT